MIKTLMLSPSDGKTLSFTEQELYWEYKNELWDYLGCERQLKSVVDDWYLQVIRSDCYIIRVLDTLETPEQVGFVFICVNDNCPEPFDFYIQDCYLLPEYRRRRIIWDAMQTFVGRHPGRYCLYLIDNNIPAVSLWGKLFDHFHYQEWWGEKLPQVIEMEDEKTHFHGWM